MNSTTSDTNISSRQEFSYVDRSFITAATDDSEADDRRACRIHKIDNEAQVSKKIAARMQPQPPN
jgi:hypothetical protein